MEKILHFSPTKKLIDLMFLKILKNSRDLFGGKLHLRTLSTFVYLELLEPSMSNLKYT